MLSWRDEDLKRAIQIDFCLVDKIYLRNWIQSLEKRYFQQFLLLNMNIFKKRIKMEILQFLRNILYYSTILTLPGDSINDVLKTIFLLVPPTYAAISTFAFVYIHVAKFKYCSNVNVCFHWITNWIDIEYMFFF